VRAILGLGDLVHDAFYDREAGSLRYRGSRGGGSVWNILANASAGGARTGGIGVAGEDARRDVAVADNESLGIELLWLGSSGAHVTCTMHHFQRANPPLYGGSYQTTGRCRACQRRPTFAKLADDRRLKSVLQETLDRDPGIFVADRLSKTRSDWALALRRRNWITAIDIGYPGYLNYYRPEFLADLVSSFTVVFVQASVANALEAKLHEPDEAGIARRFGSILMVSNGDEGMRVYDGRRGSVRRFEVRAPDCQVVDTVGAGDCLFGSLLSGLTPAEAVDGVPQLELRDVQQMCSEAMESVIPALGSIGARGHLGGQEVVLPGVEGGSGDLAHLTRAKGFEGPCPICGDRGSTAEGRKRSAKAIRPLSKSNVSQLRSRVGAVVETEAAVEACRQIVDAPCRTVVCGTGGSYPAARAIANVLNNAWSTDDRGGFAVAARPLDILQGLPRVDRILGVSYSGRSPDVWRAIETVRANGAEVALVTAGRVADTVRNDPDIRVIQYGTSESGHGRRLERGFISFTGTVAPVALIVTAVEGVDAARDVLFGSGDVSSEAGAYGRALSEVCGNEEGGLAVIASYWAAPAMDDIESKFVEGSLAPIVCHDAKDFSHGRFVSISSDHALSQGVLLLGVGGETSYDQLLFDTLRRELDQVYLLKSRNEGALGALELLVAVQQFAVEFALEKGFDISRPGEIAAPWSRLYRWDGQL